MKLGVVTVVRNVVRMGKSAHNKGKHTSLLLYQYLAKQTISEGCAPSNYGSLEFLFWGGEWDRTILSVSRS